MGTSNYVGNYFTSAKYNNVLTLADPASPSCTSLSSSSVCRALCLCPLSRSLKARSCQQQSSSRSWDWHHTSARLQHTQAAQHQGHSTCTFATPSSHTASARVAAAAQMLTWRSCGRQPGSQQHLLQPSAGSPHLLGTAVSIACQGML